MIYFDSGATSLQKPPEVARAVLDTMTRCSSVGRSGHGPALLAARRVHETRCLAAELFGAEPDQVVFTMNATHGLNLAICSLVGPGDRVIISGMEHNAVTRPLRGLGARVTVAARTLFAPREAVLEDFRRALETPAAAVICTQMSNVFGWILPVEELGALCRSRGVPLIVDASQSAGLLPLSLRASGARFIAMPGHKGLCGPQGTGLLLCAQGGEPLLRGGTGSTSLSQEMPDFLPDRLEAGTHNVPGIAGLGEGLKFVMKKGPEALLAHEKRLVESLAGRLEGMEGLTLYRGREQGGVLSLRLRGRDPQEAAELLGSRGAALRGGLHCAPLAHESAGTLPLGTLRASFGPFNTLRETEQFGALFRKLLDVSGKTPGTSCY